jgi:hypothetical protein
MRATDNAPPTSNALSMHVFRLLGRLCLLLRCMLTSSFDEKTKYRRQMRRAMRFARPKLA